MVIVFLRTLLYVGPVSSYLLVLFLYYVISHDLDNRMYLYWLYSKKNILSFVDIILKFQDRALRGKQAYESWILKHCVTKWLLSLVVASFTPPPPLLHSVWKKYLVRQSLRFLSIPCSPFPGLHTNCTACLSSTLLYSSFGWFGLGCYILPNLFAEHPRLNLHLSCSNSLLSAFSATN